MARFRPAMEFAVGDRVKVGSKNFAPLAELTAEVGRAWEAYCAAPADAFEAAGAALYAVEERRYAASVALPFLAAPTWATVTRVLEGLGTYYLALDSGEKWEALACCVVSEPGTSVPGCSCAAEDFGGPHDGGCRYGVPGEVACSCGACLGDRDDLSTGPTLAPGAGWRGL